MNSGNKYPKKILKVFSGPHIGAEILLSDGLYTIGRSDECDIIFFDESVENKHAILKIEEGNASIVLEPSAYGSIDTQVAKSEREVAVFDYIAIALGTTCFALGEQGGDWSQVRTPTRYVNKEEYKSTIENINTSLVKTFAKKVGLKTESVLVQYTDRKFSLAHERISNLTGARSTQKNAIKKSDKNSRSTKNYLLNTFFLIFFLLFLAACHAIYTGDETTEQSNFQKDFNVISDIISQDEMFSDVNLDQQGAQSMKLSGYVFKEESFRYLMNSTKEIKSHVHVDIAIGEVIVRNTSELLGTMGLKDINLTYEGGGNLSASGYVESFAAWNKTKLTLLRDIPDINNISDSDIEDIQKKLDNLTKKLEEIGLAKKAKVVASKRGTLVVNGMLSFDERKQVRDLVKVYRESNKLGPVLESDIKDTNKSIKMNIKSVHMGDFPYIVAGNSEKFFAGAFLPNGYVLEEIKADNIILSKNDVEVVYQIKH